MDIRIAVVLLSSAHSDHDDTSQEEVGSLHMYHCNVIEGYAVTFSCGSMQSKVVHVDNLTPCNPSKLEFSLKTPNMNLALRAMNMCEYNQFSEAISLTKEIIDMKLQLNVCLRDCFFDGVFANIDKDDIPFDNLTSFLSNASASILDIIGHNTTFATTDSTSLPSQSCQVIQKNMKSKVNTQSGKAVGRLNYSNMVCVYCDTPGSLEQRNIQVHPYVPVTMDKKVLYLCLPCHNNWLRYRQTADQTKQLVLPGEFNEEVCCVCSDSPSELVLCCSCPRSYCSPCLSKLLTHQQNVDMATEENWQCLCCVHSPEAFQEFTSKLNLAITTQNSVLPLNLPRTESVAEPKSKSKPKPEPEQESEKKITAVSADSLQVLSNRDVTSDSTNDRTRSAKRQRRSPVKNIDYITLEEEQKMTRKRNKVLKYDIEEVPEIVNENENDQESKRRRSARQKSGIVKAVYQDEKHEIKSQQKVKKDSKSRVTVEAKVSSPNVISPLKVEADLPPVNKDLDEAYYFSQYVESDTRRVLRDQKDGETTETEDFCFLCKDGGDLIECDHGRKGSTKCKGGIGCRKVYHEYCLGYSIPDEQKIWICMRHYCSVCGSKDLVYQCQYCPLSCCQTCFVLWNEKNKLSQFVELKKYLPSAPTSVVKRKKGRKLPCRKISPAEAKIIPITCGTCLRMFQRSFERGLLCPDNFNIGSLRNVTELQEVTCSVMTDEKEELSSPGSSFLGKRDNETSNDKSLGPDDSVNEVVDLPSSCDNNADVMPASDC